jgi:hypothetical protein
MNKPSKQVELIAKNIIKQFSQDCSLNWCEKRKAWGVLAYDFNVGSYWLAFILVDRNRK